MLYQRDLMHLRKVTTQTSLSCPRRQTRDKLFVFFFYLCPRTCVPHVSIGCLKIVVIMDPKVLLYMLYNRDASTISQIILTFIDLEKEAFWFQNIAVTSILSFSHNIFFSSQNKFQFLSRIYFVFCKCFILDWSKILSFGKEFSPFSEHGSLYWTSSLQNR